MSRSRHLVMPEAQRAAGYVRFPRLTRKTGGLRAMMKTMIESMAPPAMTASKGGGTAHSRTPGNSGRPRPHVHAPGTAGPLPVHLDILAAAISAGSATSITCSAASWYCGRLRRRVGRLPPRTGSYNILAHYTGWRQSTLSMSALSGDIAAAMNVEVNRQRTGSARRRVHEDADVRSSRGPGMRRSSP